MTVADTSALVALLDAGHPHHRDAQRDLAEGHVTVTRGTLAEAATVIRRLAKDAGQDGTQAARQALAAITALAGFREAPHVELADVLKLHQQDGSLSFVDAWNLGAALQANERLVSYDKGLRAAHGRRQPAR
jgi:predicted nucleic acid-binding protein